MIKVSIIVPVYNTKMYLTKCLDSIVNQTLQEIEIILVNDGSTDGSNKVLEQYRANYPNKIVLIHQENQGQGAARNAALKIAKGEYIGFVDSDDYIDLAMYENLYVQAKMQELDLIECDYLFVTEENKKLKTYGYVRKYKSQKDMLIDSLVSPWNKMIRKKIIDDHDVYFPEGLIYEDTSFFIKLVPYIVKWNFNDESFVTHIYRGTSTMNINKSKKVRDIFKVVEDYIDFYKSNKLLEDYKTELEYFTLKILLNSSMKRISLIDDKKLRRNISRETFEFLISKFPKYRKNPIIPFTIQGLYMKFTRPTIQIPYLFLLRKIILWRNR